MRSRPRDIALQGCGLLLIVGLLVLLYLLFTSFGIDPFRG